MPTTTKDTERINITTISYSRRGTLKVSWIARKEAGFIQNLSKGNSTAGEYKEINQHAICKGKGFGKINLP